MLSWPLMVCLTNSRPCDTVHIFLDFITLPTSMADKYGWLRFRHFLHFLHVTIVWPTCSPHEAAGETEHFCSACRTWLRPRCVNQGACVVKVNRSHMKWVACFTDFQRAATFEKSWNHIKKITTKINLFIEINYIYYKNICHCLGEYIWNNYPHSAEAEKRFHEVLCF